MLDHLKRLGMAAAAAGMLGVALALATFGWGWRLDAATAALRVIR